MKTLIILAAIALATPALAQMDRDEQRLYDQGERMLQQGQASIDARFMDLAAQQDRLRMIQQNDEFLAIQREILRRSANQPRRSPFDPSTAILAR